MDVPEKGKNHQPQTCTCTPQHHCFASERFQKLDEDSETKVHTRQPSSSATRTEACTTCIVLPAWVLIRLQHPALQQPYEPRRCVGNRHRFRVPYSWYDMFKPLPPLG